MHFANWFSGGSKRSFLTQYIIEMINGSNGGLVGEIFLKKIARFLIHFVYQAVIWANGHLIGEVVRIFPKDWGLDPRSRPFFLVFFDESPLK